MKRENILPNSIAILLTAGFVGIFIPWIRNSVVLTAPWFYGVWTALILLGLLTLRYRKHSASKAASVVLFAESAGLTALLLITVLAYTAVSSMP